MKNVKGTKVVLAVNLIFPHQIFKESFLLQNDFEIYLIEEFLFFKQYAFHKQKIAFHRATMKVYQSYLESLNKKVHYIEAGHPLADISIFSKEIESRGIDEIHFIDPCDDWLEQRLDSLAKYCKIETFESPLFLNTTLELSSFFKPEKKSFFQTSFYKQQRIKRKILVDEEENPAGGKWTFDSDNRKKYPKNKTAPGIHYPDHSETWVEAVDYTEKHFALNPGSLSKQRIYPLSFQEADDWLTQFLQFRFYEFGAYEDAVVRSESVLHHSLLSPLMNIGLILPHEIVERSLAFAEENQIPLNSTEGFIRQIIGWREFIRGMYWSKGRYSRTRNFWKFKRKIPKSFYDGSTGIEPIDQTIKKVLKTGYCHHIERLMLLGNFMLLCEFDPDEVHRWFMELFIDAYDWVMVPNVYGMCLFADGGTFATKPYIGASNYLRKMSDYPSGEWEAIWDGLFWRFIIKQKDFFSSNPRTSMLVHSLNRMSDEKQKAHLEKADAFLEKLGSMPSVTSGKF